MGTFIQSALDAIARLFGYSEKRSALKNTDDMRNNAEVRDDEKARGEAIKVAAGDDMQAKRKASSGAFIKPLTMALMLAVGCSACTTTIRPKPVTSTAIDFDGNYQDAGILGKAPDGSVIVTEFARERYNRLLEVYGEWFIPVRRKDKGVTPAAISPTRGQTYYMDRAAEAAYYWMVAEERKR